MRLLPHALMLMTALPAAADMLIIDGTDYPGRALTMDDGAHVLYHFGCEGEAQWIDMTPGMQLQVDGSCQPPYLPGIGGDGIDCDWILKEYEGWPDAFIFFVTVLTGDSDMPAQVGWTRYADNVLFWRKSGDAGELRGEFVMFVDRAAAWIDYCHLPPEERPL